MNDPWNCFCFVQANAFSPNSSSLPGNVDTTELKRTISFLMDNIGFLNTTGVFHVMCQVCEYNSIRVHACIRQGKMLFKKPFWLGIGEVVHRLLGELLETTVR